MTASIGSATGGGLLRRETPYLAIAAGDPEWIAAERAVIEHYAAETINACAAS